VTRLLACITACHCLGAVVWAQDLDRDGLDDILEQALLERFRPTFVLSVGECDGSPARFEAGTAHPVPVARDGTTYGQATPVGLVGPAEAGHADGPAKAGPYTDGPPTAGRYVELHYYHLWARDCGRAGHALDAEHVSALVAHAEPLAPVSEGEAARDPHTAQQWTAFYWYAAAHEDTVCDASSGARASAVRAETVGPYVYVSRGKHASYLNPAHCRWGCGGDACALGAPVPHGLLINIGERDRPLNGATWAQSNRWPLAFKFASDFDPVVRARLDRAGPSGIVALMRRLQTAQTPLLAGDTAIDAVGTAAAATSEALEATGEALDATGSALEATATATGNAVQQTAGAVGTALKRTASGIARFLRLK
jgi:hypothetical protein